MKCVLVNRELDQKEINEILNWKTIGNCSLITLGELQPGLENMGFKKYELPTGQKSEINNNLLRTLVNLGDKLIDGRYVSDRLGFEETSAWYYQRFRAYHTLREIAYEYAALERFAGEYENVIFYTNKKKFIDYSNLSASIVLRQQENARSKKINFLSLINYGLFLVIRSLLSVLKIRKLHGIKHILLDHAERQACLDIKTMQMVDDNYVLANLFNIIDSEFVIINFAQVPRFLSGGKFKIRKSHFANTHKDKTRLYGEYLFLKAIISRRIRVKVKTVSKKLYREYIVIENSDLTRDEKLIISLYRSLHKSTMFYLLKYFAFDQLFSKYSFKTISAIDENSPGVKSILDAAKKYDIKTIGIQHGAISGLSVAYIYSALDRDKKAMTDYTLLWGRKWKDTILNESNYLEESLRITGQIRTDIIPKLQSLDKTEILKNIPKDKKIIVFASQPQPDPKLRMQAALDVFTSVRDMNDVFLVVKLHPGERNDKEYYHQLAGKVNCLNYKIVYDIDLFLLISTCDILITCYSTVGMETIYFYKPLIIHDPLKIDMQSYHSEGVAFRATNDEELKEYILGILNGELNINKEAYDKFIFAYAYKIDGRASERCLSFIRSL